MRRAAVKTGVGERGFRNVVAVLVMSAAVASGAHYRIEPGDTLSGIAADHGVSMAALASANDIPDPDAIFVGTVLAIPGDVGDGESGTSGGAGPAIHVVLPGETLGGIARRYGRTVEQLATANGITDGRILAGAALRLDGSGLVVGGESGSGRHVVAPGETLSGIAARYGVGVAALASANGLADPDRIIAGATLTVPGGWVCPVAGARYTNDWGLPRSGGRFHEGTDLFAPRGTPVRAPVAGTVRYEKGSIGGHQFRLTAADGTVYIGSHLEGGGTTGSVFPGGVVGSVGTSGNAAGSQPMLHLEILSGGSAHNPYPTLRTHGC